MQQGLPFVVDAVIGIATHVKVEVYYISEMQMHPFLNVLCPITSNTYFIKRMVPSHITFSQHFKFLITCGYFSLH